ncbi:MAG: hypothetical protein LBO09_07145 [Candidatus Peribacteria bacterium]|nr:hypothetical protein [Candidatus Peribacteria bacterium]
MFPAQVATDHSPGITIVPDESPWGMDYMRIISSCSTNGSCYNQWSYKDLMNQNITPTISQMPTTISL